MSTLPLNGSIQTRSVLIHIHILNSNVLRLMKTLMEVKSKCRLQEIEVILNWLMCTVKRMK